MSNVVMAGSLGEFDVPAVLQAVSLSRQYTLIRLWDEDSQPSGEIRIKAGQVVEAACENNRGKMAFASIMERPHSTFRVERMSDPVAYPDPVGSLSSLLLSVAAAPAKPQPKRTVVPMRSAPKPPRVTAAAPPRPPAAAPSASRPQAPTLRSSTQVAVEQAAPELVQTVASYPTLEGFVAITLGATPRAQAWDRQAGPVSADAIATFAVAVSQAQQASLAGAFGQNDPATITLELGRARIVIEQAGVDTIVAYRFAASVPLGVVRHCVARSRRELASVLATGGSGRQAAI